MYSRHPRSTYVIPEAPADDRALVEWLKLYGGYITAAKHWKDISLRVNRVSQPDCYLEAAALVLHFTSECDAQPVRCPRTRFNVSAGKLMKSLSLSKAAE